MTVEICRIAFIVSCLLLFFGAAVIMSLFKEIEGYKWQIARLKVQRNCERQIADAYAQIIDDNKSKADMEIAKAGKEIASLRATAEAFRKVALAKGAADNGKDL